MSETFDKEQYLGTDQAKTYRRLNPSPDRNTPEIEADFERLMQDGYVIQRLSASDRRQRLLHLTQAGTALETRLTSVQGRRFAAAYREAGVDAVAGFQRVLQGLLDNSTVNQLTRHDQSAID